MSLHISSWFSGESSRSTLRGSLPFSPGGFAGRRIPGSTLSRLLLLGLFGAPFLMGGCSNEVTSSQDLPVEGTGAERGDFIDDSFTSRLPLRFEENRGQAAASVRYVARGSEYTLFMCEDEVVLALSQMSHDAVAAGGRSGRSLIRMSWSSGDIEPKISGEEALPGVANYMIGSSSFYWALNLPTYERVKYERVYPGIDAYYSGREGRLENTLVVAAGADPRPLRLTIEGPEDIRIDRDGRLVLTTGGEATYMLPAIAYQTINGSRIEVATEYKLLATDEVGIVVGDYDSSEALTIEPVLSFSTQLGGADDDTASSIALDETGNIYITGQTWSTELAPGVSGYDTSFNGSSTDAFVSKISSDGTTVLFSTYLGGSVGGDAGYAGWDSAEGLAVDAFGNVYVTGYTYATDFPTTPFAHQSSHMGGQTDIFVSKLSPRGNFLIYSTYIGGSSNESAEAIAVNGWGETFITGHTYSEDFPVTSGVVQSVNQGWADAFVTRINRFGSGLQFSTYLGGSAGTNGTWGDYGKDIVLDDGDVIVVGHTLSADFPATEDAFQTRKMGSYDGFVAKLDGYATKLMYSSYFGGVSMEVMAGVDVGPDGDVYISGTTLSSDLPTTEGVFQPDFGGGSYDTFLARMNLSALGEEALVFATYLGGEDYDYGRGLAVDGEGNISLIGYTSSLDFPVSSDAYQGFFAGGDYDATITRVSADASSILYSTFLGGIASDTGSAIAVDTSGGILATGKTRSPDFGEASEEPTDPEGSSEESDIFVVRLAFPSDGIVEE